MGSPAPHDAAEVEMPGGQTRSIGPTPFTVIAGFLGAGKTTLLNHVLANARGLRCAVLVNDFGSINIDASLIASHDGETMSLSNGCVCCSMANGFIETMLKVTAERARFDHVVVEASGVAEPERIMDFARLDPELDSGAIVVVVDAAQLAQRLSDTATAELVLRQVLAADVVLMNKVDLVDKPTLEAVAATVRELRPSACQVRTLNSSVPLELVLGADYPDVTRERVPQGAPSASALGASGSDSDEAGYALRMRGVDQAASRSDLADRFHTISLMGKRGMSRRSLHALNASLDDTVVRGKGIVQLADEPGWHSWQRVGARSEIHGVSVEESTTRHGFEAVLISTAPFDAGQLALPAHVTVAGQGNIS